MPDFWGFIFCMFSLFLGALAGLGSKMGWEDFVFPLGSLHVRAALLPGFTRWKGKCKCLSSSFFSVIVP